jgi:hypothetical protein
MQKMEINEFNFDNDEKLYEIVLKSQKDLETLYNLFKAQEDILFYCESEGVITSRVYNAEILNALIKTNQLSIISEQDVEDIQEPEKPVSKSTITATEQKKSGWL